MQNKIRMAAVFTSETLQTRRQRSNIYKIWKGPKLNQDETGNLIICGGKKARVIFLLSLQNTTIYFFAFIFLKDPEVRSYIKYL